MSRYIDADKLIKFFPDDGEGNWTYNVTAQSYINIQPTADVVPMEYHERCVKEEIRKRVNTVEVVRCKDCEHGEIDDEDFSELYLCRYHGSSWNEGNHFCSYGERKILPKD